MKDFIINNREISEENVVVIPNWHRDLSEKNIEPVKSEKRKFTVSYLGNMGTCQDMDTIISAMELLKDNDNIEFVFAGHGNKVSDIEDAAEKFGNAKVYGFLQGEEYKKVLSDSDCFLVSLEKSIVGLGVPSKTYSYMMMGKPIISIMDDCDINKDIVQYNCGYTIKNGDHENLVKSICELSENSEKAKLMGQGSRKVFDEKYTSEICLNEYCKMLKELIK
jgi:glycosyltransferase involved in cell wall biosynthesis